MVNNPKSITTKVSGATYEIPTFAIGPSGVVNGPAFELKFCKGNKDDANSLRQTGFFTETLLAVCKEYLTEVNVGELSSRETSTAITKIDEALMWLNKRSEDRKLREVQNTYKK